MAVAVGLYSTATLLTPIAARASMNAGISSDGWTPVAMAAERNHEDIVRLLAHLGARLVMPNGRGFWLGYQNDDPWQAQMRAFWPRIIAAGGDEPTEESRRIRRRMMVQAKMHDPRDGGPDAEPL